MAGEKNAVQSSCSGVGTCEVHPLMERLMSENRADMAAIREMFTQFMTHAAEEHSRIRDEIILVAKTAHEARGRSDVTPGEPHPLQRADDYEERVALTLSRRDFWKLLGVGIICILLLVGFALVAGRDGLVIWNPIADKIRTP